MAENRALFVLRRRSEFLRLLKKGRRISPCHWLVVNYQLNSSCQIRCGWTLSRKVGNAVTRNKYKRWCREYFRTKIRELDREELGLDINIVFRVAVKKRVRELKYDEFQQIMDKAWQTILRSA